MQETAAATAGSSESLDCYFNIHQTLNINNNNNNNGSSSNNNNNGSSVMNDHHRRQSIGSSRATGDLDSMSMSSNTAFSDVYGGGSGIGGKLRNRNNTNPRRAAHIRILVLGPPLGFPRCFDDYYHYNIEAMISGPEVAMALFEWVSNTDERKRLQVERAANELKQKILLDETNSSNQKAAAALKPSPPTMTNNNSISISAMNGGGCNTAVATTKTKEGVEGVLATTTTAASSGDNHSRASSSGRSSTKSSGSLAAAPIQQQIPSATLTNVTGSDLAKEVREILKNQKLAAETQKQQQQEHHQQQQLQLKQQKQLHHQQDQNRNSVHSMNGGQQTPASGNSTNSSTVTPVSSIQDLTASTAASTLVSAFSVGPGQHDNNHRSGGLTTSSSLGGQNSNNSGGTVKVFAGLEEIARHSRIRQKVIASGVFHDHGDDEDDEDDSCTGVVDSAISGDDMTKSSQQRQNHDRDSPEDGDNVVSVSSPNNKQPTTSSNRSRRIPTNTNRQALPMTIPTKKRLRWHALVDSGMGRLGFKTNPVSKDDQGKRRDTVEILKELVDCEVALDCPIEFYGMCTHMADASNSTSTFTDSQMNKFKSLLKRMRNAGISVPTISTDNSAALLTTNLTHFTTNAKELLAQTDADSRGFVRIGGAIYGQRPSFSQLRAVSTLMASVRHVATLKEGESVGYDRAYVAPMNVRIATLTIGFADGYPRELGNGIGRVSIRGHLFPVTGNVCMDMLMVELGPAGDKHGIGAQVVVGDTAVLWGPDDGEEGEGHVRLQDLAAILKTTQSALTCGLNKERVLRQYA